MSVDWSHVSLKGSSVCQPRALNVSGPHERRRPSSSGNREPSAQKTCLRQATQPNIVAFYPPIMKSPFDLLPSITGDKLPFEPYPGATSVIGLIFQNVDTTYKFFWFLSVLHKAKVARFRTDLQLEIRELAREMIAQAWPCRRLFKLWFGHQDRLQRLIDQLAQNSGLADSARLDEVRDAALELSEVDLSVLQEFVPYRFLTPWLRSALVGVNDHARNQASRLVLVFENGTEK